MSVLETTTVIRLSDDVEVVINASDFDKSVYREVGTEPTAPTAPTAPTEEVSTEDAILDAVVSLDTEDDSVWTQGGLPKIDVVEGLVSLNLTRKQVNQATENATRELLREEQNGTDNGSE